MNSKKGDNMNKDLIKTGLSILEKSNRTIIASIDDDGFPNLKLC
jgi:hypothetical protein